eukprot:356013-Chlamydomonas_euryale.AAC.1
MAWHFQTSSRFPPIRSGNSECSRLRGSSPCDAPAERRWPVAADATANDASRGCGCQRRVSPVVARPASSAPASDGVVAEVAKRLLGPARIAERVAPRRRARSCGCAQGATVRVGQRRGWGGFASLVACMLASPGMHAALARMAAASRSMAAHGSSATPAAASSAWQCIDVMARPVTMTASDTIQGIQLRPPKLRRITTCVAARWAVDSGTPPPRLPAGPPDGGDEPPPATSSSSRRFAAQFNLTDAMVQVESQSAALADEGAARLILKPHMAQSIQESMKLIQLVRAYQV